MDKEESVVIKMLLYVKLTTQCDMGDMDRSYASGDIKISLSFRLILLFCTANDMLRVPQLFRCILSHCHL